MLVEACVTNAMFEENCGREELSNSARSLCRPWHAFPALFSQEIYDDNEGVSATGKVVARFNPTPEDVGILPDDDAWARQ